MSHGIKTVFSPCRTYRYTLWRVFKPEGNFAVFIGLNPSTADEITDDPTIRRCIGFAKKWNFAAVCMLNIFAFRNTNPLVLQTVCDPIGPRNNLWIETIANKADLVVAAWGNRGSYLNRSESIKYLIHKQMYCLGLTKSGQPKHPLYIAGDMPLIKYR